MRSYPLSEVRLVSQRVLFVAIAIRPTFEWSELIIRFRKADSATSAEKQK
jgi:hypothetical protein